MAVTAALIKELRERTGVGMSACKNALVETDGNMDAAIEFLRKQGLANAAKKAGRIAAEGLSYAYISEDNSVAVAVEVNSETDFVAKNEKFQNFVKEVAQHVVTNDCANVDEFLASPWGGEFATVQDALNDMISVIGEKLSIRRFAKISGDCVASYTHGGGRIGVIVAADGASGDAVQEALTNVAMQIAAMNPQYISRDDMSDAELAKLREIIQESALNDPATLPKPILNKLIEKAVTDKVWSDEDIAIYNEKKSNMQYLFNFLSKEAAEQLAQLALADRDAITSDKIFHGLVEGRVSKQLKEICLLDQVYVKAEDGKQTVAAYLAQVAKKVGADFKLKGFVRFETGEGIEKKVDDFAAEVAAQAGL